MKKDDRGIVIKDVEMVYIENYFMLMELSGIQLATDDLFIVPGREAIRPDDSSLQMIGWRRQCGYASYASDKPFGSPCAI